MAYKTLWQIYKFTTIAFFIGFILLAILSTFIFFLLPILVVFFIVGTAIIYLLEVVMAKLALKEIRTETCPNCSARSQIQFNNAGYYLCQSCDARFKENGKVWKKKKDREHVVTESTSSEESDDSLGEALAKRLGEELDIFKTAPDPNPTKQREDAVPCKVCGKPTWSATATCVLCSQDI